MEEKIIDAIMKKVWEYAQTYTVRRVKTVLDEGDSPVWYLPDEFGMRLGHSNDPNVRTFPFFYGFTGQAFSLMIPIKDINSEGTFNYYFIILLLFRRSYSQLCCQRRSPSTS